MQQDRERTRRMTTEVDLGKKEGGSRLGARKRRRIAKG